MEAGLWLEAAPESGEWWPCQTCQNLYLHLCIFILFVCICIYISVVFVGGWALDEGCSRIRRGVTLPELPEFVFVYFLSFCVYLYLYFSRICGRLGLGWRLLQHQESVDLARLARICICICVFLSFLCVFIFIFQPYLWEAGPWLEAAPASGECWPCQKCQNLYLYLCISCLSVCICICISAVFVGGWALVGGCWVVTLPELGVAPDEGDANQGIRLRV